MNIKSNSSRVLRNTISLYIRMVVLTIISLFTVRVVLHVLGEVDYGLYNVVGGFVTFFGFISGTLAIASQRYFAISLATNDWKSLNKYFSINIYIYIFFIGLVLILSETVGLWFVMNRLTVPDNRMQAAIIVYELSIANFIIGLLTSPFQALLIADENLSIYSIISIVEGAFKIIVAYLLYTIHSDKLIMYSILLFVVCLSVNGIYIIYSFRKYKRLEIHFQKDKSGYKEVFSYMNWNLIGAMGSVGKSQGINIIMNVFFGPSINAARGIATHINTVVSSFSQNFMKAVDPQITKKYANRNKDKLIALIHSSSKLSYYLLYIIILPLIANMNYILTLWLKEDVPDYTLQFTILALIDALVLSITEPFGTGVQATGNVKFYQLTVGILSLLNLPVVYTILGYFENPLIPFMISIFLSVLMSVGRILVYKKINQDFSIADYIIRVLFPVFIVTIFSSLFTFFIINNADYFVNFLVNVILSVGFTGMLIFFIGLNREEKNLLLQFGLLFIKKEIKNPLIKNDDD